jgi:uncharacterized membrane protein YphA (DoxX/SURF4 family)
LNDKLTLSLRIFLGTMFIVFGLNGFFGFITVPPMNEAATKFMTALEETGYFIPMLKGIEVVTGCMLLTGYKVPLALVMLAPIVVNIFMFHFVIAASGIIFALVLLGIYCTLLVAYKQSFKKLLE